MSKTAPAQAFAKHLESILAQRGLKKAQFARAAGINETLFSRIMASQRPPDKNLEKWAKVLDLEGESRQNFLRLGYLARAHPFLSDLFEQQRREIQSLRERLEAHKG